MYDKQIICKARAEDIDSIFSIEKKSFGNEHWSFGMIKNELINISNRITWITKIKSKVIAYCMVRFFDNEIYIVNMVVVPKMQRHGIGKLLLKNFLNEKALKSSVFLEVKAGNLPALNLYTSLGFEKMSIWNNYYQDGSDAVVI